MIWTDGLSESGDGELAYQESLHEVSYIIHVAVATEVCSMFQCFEPNLVVNQHKHHMLVS